MSRVERFTRLLEPLGYELSPLAWQLSGAMDEDQTDNLIEILSKEPTQ